ncbi:MAG: hypothetical protein GY841_16670, partial [FCB group bacterium]|nr:hypothetical protein [FCB group bacterium]
VKTATASYIGVSAGVSEASLVGIDAIDLYVTGSVDFNNASAGDRIDWSTATSEANDPEGLLADLDISSSVQLYATGSGALNVGPGNVVAVGTIEFSLSNMTVQGGGTVGELAGADVVSVSVSNASVFVGTGHAGLEADAQSPVGYSVVDIDDASNDPAIGFNVEGITFGLNTVKTATASYIGVSAGVSEASLVGIDAIDLYVTGSVDFNNASAGDRID